MADEETTASGGDERSSDRVEGKYRLLLESAPEAIFIADAESATITEVNQKAVDLTGYSESELRGTDVLDLFPSDNRSQYEQLVTQNAEKTIKSRLEDGTQLYVVGADGTEVPIEMSVSRTDADSGGVLQCIVRDITRRKEREETLRVRNQALEESTVGITISDASAEDNPIVYANEGFEQLTGYRMDNIMGRNCRFLQGEATDEDVVANIREAIEAEESIRTQILNYRAGGTPFWNKLTVAPVTDGSESDVTHYVGIQQDITARKRRNRLIEVLERVLRHNLRNDMSAIGGFADIIRERTEGELTEYADRIKATAVELTELSEKARELESMVRDAEPLDARDVVTDIDDVVADLRDEYPDTTFRVETDSSAEVMATDQLRLALRELGTNAAKHGAGSPVEVTATRDDQNVVVTVRDEGPGLPAHERRVLETGKETRLEHGSGLGLWLVNWIVTGFGGTVTATVEDGTTVTLSLSAVDAQTTPGRLKDKQYGAFNTELD